MKKTNLLAGLFTLAIHSLIFIPFFYNQDIVGSIKFKKHKVSIKSHTFNIQKQKLSKKETAENNIKNTNSSNSQSQSSVKEKTQHAILEQIPPRYPAIAIEKDWTGVVVIKISILPNGKVQNVEVAQSSGYSMLDDSALSAARQWVFNKTQQGFTIQKNIVFELKN